MHFQARVLTASEPGGSRITDLHALKPDDYPFLLASTATGGNGRFDILLAHPEQSLELKYKELKRGGPGFLEALHDWWLRERIVVGDTAQSRVSAGTDDEAPPFTGGWFIYLSYELAGEIEPVLDLPQGEADDPVALAVRCPAALIYDHERQLHTVVAEHESSHLLDTIEQDFRMAVRTGAAASSEAGTVAANGMTEADSASYLQQVARIKQYIVDGDIFQANLSRPWQLEIDADVPDSILFKRLARANPGAFAVLARLPAFSVISSSPERLVRVRGRSIETRPIAGTRPRSENSVTDDQLAEELMAHPKERAEHIMLIDLERNDLGRICIPGSIRVDELMVLVSYHTGSIGYINRDGDMDLNILIRTLVRRGDRVSFRAGGGIVADSVPALELAETRAKARGLLQVFGAQ